MVAAANPYGLPEDVFRHIQEEARRAVAKSPPMPDCVRLGLMRIMGLTPEGRYPEAHSSEPADDAELDVPVTCSEGESE